MHITIIYSSGGGNTKLVVDKIVEILNNYEHTVNIINAFVADKHSFKKTSLTILAAPTYDHGILHEPFDRLILGATGIDLSDHSYAIIGLGDDKYDKEYTVEAAHLLEQFVLTHKGNLIHDSLKINKSPVGRLDTLVTDRATSLIAKITD